MTQTKLNLLTLNNNAISVLKFLHEEFTKRGKEIRLVGGSVRDILQGYDPSDLDFATTATPEEMMEWYYGRNKFIKDEIYAIPTGLQHGTLTLMLPKNYGNIHSVEVTTLRKDIETDGRHATVEFTDDWKEDAARRDFTMNAMFLDAEGNLYDYFNGYQDLQEKHVRFIGNPDDRIEEDALRMLRYLRFRLKFGEFISFYSYNDPNLETLKRNKHKINIVSKERVWTEYLKICEQIPLYEIENWFRLLNESGLGEELGFPYAPKAAPHFPTKAFRTYPHLALATHFSLKDKEPEIFYKKYKLSMKERKDIDQFMDLRYTHYSEYNIRNAINDKNIPRHIIMLGYLAEIKDQHDYHGATIFEISTYEKKECPITAQDLIDLFGYKQGKTLGAEYRQLYIAWQISGFELTREELLSKANPPEK